METKYIDGKWILRRWDNKQKRWMYLVAYREKGPMRSAWSADENKAHRYSEDRIKYVWRKLLRDNLYRTL